VSPHTNPAPGGPPADQPTPGTAPGQGAGPAPGDSPPEPASTASPLMIAVGLLAAHPANVRADLDLDLGEEFCASVAEIGVRIPLQVTYDETSSFRVIEGHRRLAAAVKAGLAEVPCDVDPGSAGDEAGQYLDMLIANGDAYRKTCSHQRRPQSSSIS
jgi:ParB-like nuclease domain